MCKSYICYTELRVRGLPRKYILRQIKRICREYRMLYRPWCYCRIKSYYKFLKYTSSFFSFSYILYVIYSRNKIDFIILSFYIILLGISFKFYFLPIGILGVMLLWRDIILLVYKFLNNICKIIDLLLGFYDRWWLSLFSRYGFHPLLFFIDFYIDVFISYTNLFTNLKNRVSKYHSSLFVWYYGKHNWYVLLNLVIFLLSICINEYNLLIWLFVLHAQMFFCNRPYKVF